MREHAQRNATDAGAKAQCHHVAALLWEQLVVRSRLGDGQLFLIHIRLNFSEQRSREIPLPCVREHCKQHTALGCFLGGFDRGPPVGTNHKSQ